MAFLRPVSQPADCGWGTPICNKEDFHYFQYTTNKIELIFDEMAQFEYSTS